MSAPGALGVAALAVPDAQGDEEARDPETGATSSALPPSRSPKQVIRSLRVSTRTSGEAGRTR